MSSVRFGLAAVIVLTFAADISQARSITTYSPADVYHPDSSVLNSNVGLDEGYVIEDFEDETLVPGLSFDPPAAGLDFRVGSVSFWTNDAWDGSQMLINNAGGSATGRPWGNVKFNFAGGIDALGIGISNIQRTASTFWVNGIEQGTLIGDFGAPNGLGRSIYLVIENEVGDDPITSFMYDIKGYSVESVTFDHLALRGLEPESSVPEPSTLMLVGTGALGLWFYRRQQSVL